MNYKPCFLVLVFVWIVYLDGNLGGMGVAEYVGLVTVAPATALTEDPTCSE